jgi:hypothetical protein
LVVYAVVAMGIGALSGLLARLNGALPVLADSLPWRMAQLSVVFVSAVIADSGGSLPADGTVALLVQQEDKVEQNYYRNSQPYLEEPLDKLGKQIPELKKVQPAANPALLPGILGKVAGNIDGFLQHMVDLIAQERITQERLNENGLVTASERVQDNYLIVRHGNEAGGEILEYRMDAGGNHLDQVGLKRHTYLAGLSFGRLDSETSIPAGRPLRNSCSSVRTQT